MKENKTQTRKNVGHWIIFAKYLKNQITKNTFLNNGSQNNNKSKIKKINGNRLFFYFLWSSLSLSLSLSTAFFCSSSNSSLVITFSSNIFSITSCCCFSTISFFQALLAIKEKPNVATPTTNIIIKFILSFGQQLKPQLHQLLRVFKMIFL